MVGHGCSGGSNERPIHKACPGRLFKRVALIYRVGWRDMRQLLRVLSFGFVALSAPAMAQPHTAAGTRVVNQASVTYQLGSAPQPALSASVAIKVDQIIDVSAAWQDSSAVAATAGTSVAALTYVIENDSNGPDSFSLSVSSQPHSSSGFTATDCGIWFDSNNDGVYSAGDQRYSPGVNDPTLAAGARQRVFVVCTVPASATDGSESDVTLSVDSNTLTGPAGTAINESKAPFVVAETGSSQGQARVVATYVASGIDFEIPLSQTVTDANGGNQAVHGSTITYTIKVEPKGSGTGKNLRISDAIPTYTTYVPGSLTLNGVSLTDTQTDNDGGYYDAAENTIYVDLGSRASNASPDTITFKVTIN